MIAAIVVLYHPDGAALEDLQSSLIGQVDHILMIDNTPGSSSRKPGFVREGNTYIPLGTNKGIAEAQNIGIELSAKDGYSHVLFLDQDSSASPGMVDKLLTAEREILSKGVKVAAVTPQIIDERTGAFPVAVRYRALGVLSAKRVYRDCNTSCPEQTDNFISSGSLIRIDVFQAVGRMRSELFIDYVDTEWALRAHTAGFRSFCVPHATLRHSVGNAATKVLGNNVYLYDVLRYRYRMRNSVYLLRLSSMGWRWRAYYALRMPYHLLLYSMVSKNRLGTFWLLLKAIGDGWTGKLGQYSMQSELNISGSSHVVTLSSSREEHHAEERLPAKSA